MHAEKTIVSGQRYIYRPLFGSSDTKLLVPGEHVRVLRPASRCESEREGFYLVETLDGKRKAFASMGSLHEHAKSEKVT